MKALTLTLTLFLCSFYCQAQQDFGKSLKLDGVSDYLLINDTSALNQTTSLTIEARINACNTTGLRTIASKSWCQSSRNAYTLAVRDGYLEWTWDTNTCSDGASNFKSDSAVISSDVWTHVAVTHTTTGVVIYVNGKAVSGKLVSGSFSTIKTTTEPLRIGAYKKYSGVMTGYFDGLIDEFRFWSNSLDSTTINGRYNSVLLGNEAGLVCYYNIDSAQIGQTSTFYNKAIGSNLDAKFNSGLASIHPYNYTCNGTLASATQLEVANELAYSVYPNPTNGQFVVDLKETEETVSVNVYNAYGQIVISKLLTDISLVDLELSGPAGIYFLEIETAKGKEMTKILKN